MHTHLRNGLLLTVVFSGTLIAAGPQQSQTRELIPGYVDAQGQVHPEKLLSYIDALHRAADADRADARIVQLESHLSEIVAQLAQTRALAARQEARAQKAELDAAKQRRLVAATRQSLQVEKTRGDKLTRSLKRTRVHLRKTRRSLIGQQTQVTLLRADHHRLQKQVSGLIVSLQHSQNRAASFSAHLARTTHERNSLHTSHREASAAIQKLKSELEQSRDVLQKTTASLQSTKTKLSVTERALKQKRSTTSQTEKKEKDPAEKTRSPKVESKTSVPQDPDTPDASESDKADS